MSRKFSRSWRLGSTVFSVLILFAADRAAAKRYGETLCQEPGFHCLTVDNQVVQREVKTKSGTETREQKVAPSWENLFPDERERELVMKVNRTNLRLRKGMVIAVPDDLAGKTLLDFSPFPKRVDPDGEPYEDPECKPVGEPHCRLECTDQCQREGATPAKPDSGHEGDGQCATEGEHKFRMVCVQDCMPAEDLACDWQGKNQLGGKLLIMDPKLLAFAAYDETGNLVRWGPAAGGKDYCPDVGRGCRTRVGVFKILSKKGRYQRSGKYPIGCVGAACAVMPYFMEFSPGYGFHASTNVPGMNASHGCVRLFFEDAEWLNKEFVEIGTKVIIRPY